MLPSQRALFDMPREVCFLNAAAWSPLPLAAQEAGRTGVARKGRPWLIDQAFPTDADNPFLSAGYFHGMSFYGREPGALYGAVERSGEACSTYDYVTGKHRTDGMLIPIDLCS